MVVIDGFAPIGLVRAAQATWLPESSGLWHRYENGKLATKSPHMLPVAVSKIIDIMAKIDADNLVGAKNSFPDIEHLHGAGMHQTAVGCGLGLHLDSERHPTLPWKREASAVLYLDDCDGGQFEECDENGNTIRRIDCKENRLVLFATPGQWHRVAVNKTVRRSICLFFWSLSDDVQTGSYQAYFK